MAFPIELSEKLTNEMILLCAKYGLVGYNAVFLNDEHESAVIFGQAPGHRVGITPTLHAHITQILDRAGANVTMHREGFVKPPLSSDDDLLSLT
jgi:hypothetical protein